MIGSPLRGIAAASNSRRCSPCLLLFAGLLLPFAASAARGAPPVEGLDRLENVHRILFLGDSITYDGQYIEDIETYFVTRYPGRRFEFLNLGLPSETVSGLSEPGHAGGKFPRPDLHERLARVLQKTRPDLVFACYGMNDGIYEPFSQEYFQKFQEGIRWLHQQVTASGAAIIHITPPVFDAVAADARKKSDGKAASDSPYDGYNAVLDRYSDWLLSQRAAGWSVLDLHGPMNQWLADHRKSDPVFTYTRDGVHPDAAGHWFIARRILGYLGAADGAGAASLSAMLSAQPDGDQILRLVQRQQRILKDAWLTYTGHKRPGMKQGLPLDEAQSESAALETEIESLAAPDAAAPFPGAKSRWEGFDRYDFEFEGHPAIVVVPPHALPGNPWIWRGEFFGAYANVDAALVAKGFHLAYLRVPDLFGSPQAVGFWDAFYRELVWRYGLARKVALIGLSRGGLYCYNWAIANPDKVACIYADAPVCDFKSWPGGKLKGLGKGDGSAAEWAKMLKAYGFRSDAEAIAYRGNPVDNLKPLAAAHIPLLHVYGDADTTVPWQENTGVVAERYRKLGGSITLIAKAGVAHHPHGLTDPAPIVAFIEKYAEGSRTTASR